MKYIKVFNNSNDLEIYKKSKLTAPHIFLNKQNLQDLDYLEEYDQLEYISSTATGGQYIDLGCQLMNSTDDIKIDIKFNIRNVGKSSSGNDNTLTTLIGSQPEVSPWPGFVLRRRSSSTRALHLQAKWAFTNSVKWGNDKKWESKYLSYSRNEQRTWQTIYEFSETLNNMPESQVNNCPCTLFCAYDGNGNPFRYALADLYYLKFTKGNTVIRNLVPVRRKSDNAVGLYDIENDHLYVSQGDEPFVAGPIIS